jgi:non-homologous end joining protein Ku
MSEAAFVRLQQEISLEECHLQLPELWGDESFRLFSGLVSMENDIFRKIIVRQSRIAQINPRDFSLQSWTDHFYYEVCANPAVYAALEAKATAGK